MAITGRFENQKRLGRIDEFSGGVERFADKLEWLKKNPLGLEPDKLYVALIRPYLHYICPCGCGKEVDLPVPSLESDREWRRVRCYPSWKLDLDGKGIVTVSPSINDLHCGAHYFIEFNKVRWC